MKADARTEAAVVQTLMGYLDAYADKDLHKAMGAFLPDEALVNVGTGEDEVYIGPAELLRGLGRDFSQFESLRYALDVVSVACFENTAWVYANCDLDAVMPHGRSRLRARLTAVLVRQDGSWRIAQSHLSEAAGGQTSGNSFRLD